MYLGILKSLSFCQVLLAAPSSPFGVGRARGVFAQNDMTASLKTPCVLFHFLILQLLKIHTSGMSLIQAGIDL